MVLTDSRSINSKRSLPSSMLFPPISGLGDPPVARRTRLLGVGFANGALSRFFSSEITLPTVRGRVNDGASVVVSRASGEGLLSEHLSREARPDSLQCCQCGGRPPCDAHVAIERERSGEMFARCIGLLGLRQHLAEHAVAVYLISAEPETSGDPQRRQAVRARGFSSDAGATVDLGEEYQSGRLLGLLADASSDREAFLRGRVGVGQSPGGQQRPRSGKVCDGPQGGPLTREPQRGVWPAGQ